jgi:hypothetical protein
MSAVSVAVASSAAPRRRASMPAPIAWRPPDGLDRNAWISAGVRLGGLSRSSNWWVGDWLRYGTEKWGEKYVTAAKITGYDPHTLENMVYVASRFDISLRRENLSWSHHFLVAALDREQQDYWLDLAASEGISVSDLRVELRAAQRRLRSSRPDSGQNVEGDGLEGDGNEATATTCPRCGFELMSDIRLADRHQSDT